MHFAVSCEKGYQFTHVAKIGSKEWISTDEGTNPYMYYLLLSDVITVGHATSAATEVFLNNFRVFMRPFSLLEIRENRGRVMRAGEPDLVFFLLFD